MSRPAASTVGRVHTPRPWWALVVLCISLVVVTIQTSILNVALPSLVRDIGADDAELQWIVDSYIVAFAGVLLTGAALADRFGRRGVMMAGLVLCGVSSVAAALAQDPAPLIVWRTVMGIGAALVMPATLGGRGYRSLRCCVRRRGHPRPTGGPGRRACRRAGPAGCRPHRDGVRDDVSGPGTAWSPGRLGQTGSSGRPRPRRAALYSWTRPRS